MTDKNRRYSHQYEAANSHTGGRIGSGEFPFVLRRDGEVVGLFRSQLSMTRALNKLRKQDNERDFESARQEEIKQIIAERNRLHRALAVLVNDIDGSGKSLEIWAAGHPHLRAARKALDISL